MTDFIALSLLAFSAVLTFLVTSTNGQGFLPVYGFVSICIAFVWFLTRNRLSSPTTAESTVATIWLWFRRAVCFGGSVLFFVGAAWLGVTGHTPFRVEEISLLDRIFVTLLLLGMGGFSAWAGVFGHGANYYGSWKDDIKLHQENKRRYHWKW